MTDIAIIGMSGRFPDAEDINQYWQNITDIVVIYLIFYLHVRLTIQMTDSNDRSVVI